MNSSRYKLFSVMVEDVFGHGPYVQHAVVENESHERMLDAIKVFKRNNPDWDLIRMLMIEKYFGEISEDMQKTNQFGVRITSNGTFTELDMQAMREWQSTMEKLEASADAVLWL
ncbi:hypothetical protein PI124_g21629 [Phytophthora idaei]|nr:hypothetical protein PI125_g20795 [Phytophthora idaei]KAG3128298.1 hypothetical protein PI126_g21466 [Phytophthora idaei]KAG3233294.1 hypothetical protein PI124_g21629 [Phytophthora idaei]